MMWSRSWGSWLAVAMMLGSIACGGASDGATSDESADTSGGEDREDVDDGAQITGLMGTMNPRDVEGTLSPRMGRFMQCFTPRMRQVEFLGGEIRLGFRVRTDGTVAWVYPLETDIGDREAEQCVLGVARQTQFPRPNGGEAEFNWGFAFDPPDDVRPPLSWAADALGDRSTEVRALVRECSGVGAYSVTAYIEPGGRVLAAGGSAPSSEGESALDCILARVREMEMPDPGSYAAKITFAVP